MTMGIYAIQRIDHDEWYPSYVGISSDIKRRWGCHKTSLRKGYHDNKYLQRSWDKYGEDAFEFCILETVDDYDELYQLEKDYCNDFGYGDRDLVYNIAIPGEKGSWRRNNTEETKQKMREAKKGEKHPKAKLTEKQVSFILATKNTGTNQQNRDFTQPQLGDMFGVKIDCLKDVMKRRTWKHIQPMGEQEYQEFKKQLERGALND